MTGREEIDIEQIEESVATSQQISGDIIRERREKTGFSQRKFADILGISREHLNKIEAGEREPSEKLFDRMKYFLSFYDPTSKVDIMLDYIRVRFRTTNYEHVIEDILKIRMKYMLRDVHSFYGYDAQFYFGNIVVMTSDDKAKGCLLELKGQGCREYERILICQKRTWTQFLQEVKNEDAVIKRVDLAVNDRVGILDIPEMAEKLKRREYSSVFHQYKFYESGTLIGEGEENADARGNTLYIGSLKSDVYFCAYEKDYEQYVKYGKDMKEAEIRNRFEIRLKDDRAEAAVSDLLTYGDAGRTAFGIINRYIVFLKPDANRGKRSWDIDPRWKRFIDWEIKGLRLAIAPKKQDVLGDKLNWIARQCAPTLKAIRLLDASLGESDRIDAIIDAAHISPNMQKLIEQEMTEIEEIVR